MLLQRLKLCYNKLKPWKCILLSQKINKIQKLICLVVQVLIVFNLWQQKLLLQISQKEENVNVNKKLMTKEIYVNTVWNNKNAQNAKKLLVVLKNYKFPIRYIVQIALSALNVTKKVQKKKCNWWVRILLTNLVLKYKNLN